MAVNTWDGAVDTEWNDAGNWNTTGETDRVPTSADDVIIPDTSSLPNPTLSATGGNPKNVKSLTIQTNGTIVGGGIQIRVYGQNASGFAVDNDGIISGNLNLEIKTPSATDIDLAGTSGNFNNLKINDASCVATMKSDCILDGDLEIAAGELSTGTGGYGFSNLTVAGDVDIDAGAKLEGNASSGATVRLKNLTVNGTYSATGGETIITGKNGSNYMIQKGGTGTFTHNKGTVKFEADTSSGTWYATNATNVENESIYFWNLETVRTGSAGSYRFFVGGNSFYLVVLNNLTIGVNTSIFSSNGTSILRHYGPFFNIEGAAAFDNVKDVECGFITIGSAGELEFNDGDQTINCTGIRNLRGAAGISA